LFAPTELIKRYFHYLVDEFGFSIDREGYSPEVMGNAVVVFVSTSTAVKVVVDRSQVLINIGELSWPEKDWFEFGDVVQFFNPNLKDVYDFSGDSLDNQAYIVSQAKHLALLLRQYCEPLLRGDFSMQDKIREIEKKRVAEMLEHFQKLSRNYKRNTSQS
jgi:hypothetical protein